MGDVICISHYCAGTLYTLQRYFKLKDDSIEQPDIYLGAEISKIQPDDGGFWIMSRGKRLSSTVKNLDDVLALRGQIPP